MKLSILITFCNQKEFIKDALESCLNQKVNFNYEILVGLDDGDNKSRKLICDYINKNSNIKLFEIDNSKLQITSIEKASKNRLNLLKRAQGEYLTFLDGDDFFCDENRFQIMVDCLEKKPQYIAAFHDLCYFNNNAKKFDNYPDKLPKFHDYAASEYLKIHRQCSCFCYRNIFKNSNLNDFNEKVVNDSTFTTYYLKYGKFYYVPQVMFAYRYKINSIFASKDKLMQSLYSLLCAEINQNILTVHQKKLCRKHRKILKLCWSSKDEILNIDEKELKLIEKFAKNQHCYFTSSIINYANLTLIEKIKFHIYKYAFIKFKINLTVSKKQNRKLFYFIEKPNFGDLLNLYILQRLFKLNIKYQGLKKANLIAIGSFLHPNLSPRQHFGYKKIKVWGTGMIKEKEYEKEYFKRNIIPLALRGKLTKQRVEKILNKKLNCPLGDPGLLASKLINKENIKKIYKVGVILHYVDKNSKNIENIKCDNYKIIDITKNPIYVLNEIAKCEVILSSAMHGLIAADSLNIPNQWIKLSDKLYGGDYKFHDYYSIFDYTPKAIDLREISITNKTIEEIQINYKKLNFKEKIDKITENLLNVGKNI